MGRKSYEYKRCWQLPFLMVDSTDHTTPKNGLNPTVLISKNCGPFFTPYGAVSGIGLGWYYIAGNSTDSNTLGSLLVHASGVGADLYDGVHEVVAFNINDSSYLGLTGVMSIKSQTDKFRFDSNNLILSNMSGIYEVTASGLSNTILSQSAKCVENTAPSGSLAEIIMQSTNSTISDGTMTVKRSDGTTFSSKSLTTVQNAPAIRGIQ